VKTSFLPREIASQIILLVILSAVIFHLCVGAAFLIGRSDSGQRDPPAESGYIDKITDFMKVTDTLPPPARDQMLAWLKESEPRLDVKSESPPQLPSPGLHDDKLITALQSRAGPRMRIIREETSGQRRRIGFQFHDGLYITVEVPHGGPALEFDPRSQLRQPSSDGIGSPPPSDPPQVITLVFATLIFIAISFTIFLFWAARSLTRPLRKFADAVDTFAPDGPMIMLEENGPSELCAAAHALNRMRERVKIMIEQRTQMLTAISHDLRTPVTRLRLRAEFIEPSDVRSSILRDIEQMNAMVHSALSFIRDGVEIQRNALLDLGTLLQTICDEFTDMGYTVLFESPEPVYIKGNADELYRAVTNLVSNAVKFGTEVEVHLRRAETDQIEIDVVDDGPGIPGDSKAAMLEPFMRGGESRKVEALQGFGLGLPIVQSIVKAHQGLLKLLDREPHGLIARVILPSG